MNHGSPLPAGCVASFCRWQHSPAHLLFPSNSALNFNEVLTLYPHRIKLELRLRRKQSEGTKLREEEEKRNRKTLNRPQRFNILLIGCF